MWLNFYWKSLFFYYNYKMTEKHSRNFSDTTILAILVAYLGLFQYVVSQ